MKFIKKNIKKIIGILAVVLILTVAFWYGGNAPGSRGFSGFGKQHTESRNLTELAEDETGQEKTGRPSMTESETTDDQDADSQDTDRTDETSEGVSTEDPANKDAQEKESGENGDGNNWTDSPAANGSTGTEAGQDPYGSDGRDSTGTTEALTEQPTTEQTTETREPKTTEQPTTEEEPGQNTTEAPTTERPAHQKPEKPATTEEPETTEQKPTEEQTYTCTISINCDNILKNWNMLDRSKQSCVPADGWILKEVEVEFKKGQTVFDVLKDITKKKSIQLEYSFTALYGSYYIEGIHNLYEFDCGELSGWEYCVNGKFPAFGCSKYVLKDGDKIEWKYTCDLGADVGNPYFE